MFAVAADRLAKEVHAEDLAAGNLFPPIHHLRRVTARIAEAVVREARERGVAQRVLEDGQIPAAVAAAMWNPSYVPMDPAPAGREELEGAHA
jgi:malate dehydrogenase (oxaloacetate-decarboxylating)